MIRPHRLRQRLETGMKTFGPILNFNSPWFVDISGLIGFDFVLFDAEHGPLTPETAETLIRAAEAAGLSPLVRVPANVPHEILRFLDIGAVGIQVPHIDSADDARAAASAVRYHPRGQRGLAAITRAAGYGIDTGVPAYIELANREVMLMAMVETARAVEAVDAIASTEGVDIIAIGPGDLSASMGYAGERGVPVVEQAIDHVIARAHAHGRWASLPAVDVATANHCLRRGADIVQVSCAAWLVRTGRDLLAGVQQDDIAKAPAR